MVSKAPTLTEPSAASDSAPAETPRTTPAGGASRPVILLAEDETGVREMVVLALQSHGYDVVPCEDGTRAIATVDSDAHLDAAVLDLRMPGATGTEVLEHIRRGPRHRLPVLAMSAYSDDAQAREVLSRGADAFLAKPFTIEALISTLARLLAG